MAEAFDQIAKQFRRERIQYEAFTGSVETLLRNLISAIDIEPFAFECRTKTLSSLEEKIQREEKAGKYGALCDITDLSGVRVICYLQEDCDKICKLLEDEFDVDENNSISKQEEIDPDKFGYLSIHYVVGLSDPRKNLKEFKKFDGLKAEIQVRTLLQHTWAAIDWKFRYKEKKEAPKALRRRLFRISALLEAADNEFSQVKTELDAIRLQYSTNVSEGKLAISIDSESIASYIGNSEVLNSILSAASSAGVRRRSNIQSNEPSINSLVSAAEHLGFSTIEQLDNRFKELVPDADKFFKFLYLNISDKAEVEKFNPYDAALLRYLLLSGAPSGRRQLILKEKPAIKGVADVLASYAKENH